MAVTRHDILRDTFGFDAFRPGQEAVIERLERGRNVLAVMPTGAGKSLCYQVPALMFPTPTVVVSPLTALMDDQVARLRLDGVDAVAIHSGMPRDRQVDAWRDLAAGRARLAYMSPERLMGERMLEALGRLSPAMFVVDEAHCVSKWGPSFRPEYEQLSALPARFPTARIAAFTATADRVTRDDIAAKLLGGHGDVLVHGFDRPNLCLRVTPRTEWKAQLSAFLEGRADQAGIVYCLSRAFTEEVAAYLAAAGANAIPYHAGLEAPRRREAQERFMSERAVVMVATIAFGMGIDKPDIRYVCHLNLPGSMEAYYQEIGRAGRDGAPADTQLFYGLDDVRMRRHFIDTDGADDDHRRREGQRLESMVAYCETAACRRVALLGYFDEPAEPCGNCDNCLEPPVTVDATADARALLAVVVQTGEVFGAAHVVDVVRGADTEKVRQRGHNTVPGYGAGAARDRAYWQALVRQAGAAGLVATDFARYGRLTITPAGRDLMADEAGTFAFRDPVRRRPRGRAAPTTRTVPADVDHDLVTRLKQRRRDLAREAGVPAYVVFPDATLLAMARERPRTRDEMAGISGVGPKRLEQYGDAFLELTAGP